MKFLNKKFFIIIFFMFFIFLFFNINECFGFDSNYTESIEQEIISRSFKPLMYVVNNNEVYVACASDKHLYGRASDYDKYNIYHKIYVSYWGDDINGTPACLNLVDNDFGTYGYCQIFLFRDGSYVSNNDYDYTPIFLSLKDSFVYLGEVRPTFYVQDNGVMVERDFFPSTPPIPETPVVPEEEKFKIHLKDLNCGIWRNFTIQYPNYSNEKYLIYLDTFRRDYSNCTNEVEAVFKLIVFNNDSFISNEDFDNTIIVNPYYHFSNEVQKYVTRFCNNETNNLFLFNKEDKNIYIPFNALTYNVFESTLSYCSTSSNYSITQFEYVESVSQDYFNDNYDSIYGDKICSNSFFIGSNCNIISVYENTEVDVITKFVSREILDRIFYTIALGNNYRYSIAYDFNEVYNRNSSCYGSNYAFKNEFWSNYRDNHKHIVETDSEGNTVIIPETNYVDSGFVVSGSDNYIKDSNSNNLFDQNEDVIDFVPVVQTEGEKIENTGDISSVDKDIIEKDNNKNDTSSWGVIDFLKGLFGSLGDLFTFLKQALIGILDFISNIGKTILSLFVPDSDFWGSFSSDMNSYLNEHLGLIFQPFEILGNILERYNNIEFVEPRLVIPEIKVPLTDYVLMESKEVNFSSVLEIEIIGYLHNIYLCCIDVYLLFLVLNRIKQLGEEVFNK